jgi:hypothetical protein
MMDKNSEANPGTGEQGSSGKKKPYLKPAFRSEQVFERMALSCGKISPTQSQCRFSPMKS